MYISQVSGERLRDHWSSGFILIFSPCLHFFSVRLLENHRESFSHEAACVNIKNNYFSLSSVFIRRKNMICVSANMLKKIRVGR